MSSEPLPLGETQNLAPALQMMRNANKQAARNMEHDEKELKDSPLEEHTEFKQAAVQTLSSQRKGMVQMMQNQELSYGQQLEAEKIVKDIAEHLTKGSSHNADNPKPVRTVKKKFRIGLQGVDIEGFSMSDVVSLLILLGVIYVILGKMGLVPW
jgi:hypothetical protein